MGDNFREYGYNFQVKIISSLLKDRDFVNQVYDLLKPSYFDAKSLTWISQHVFTYFDQYRTTPTLEVFKAKLASVENELERTEIKTALKDAWHQIGSDDLDFIKSETKNFCINQVLKVAILESVDHLKEGKFDLIKQKVDAALKLCSTDKDFGMDYLKDIDYRYSEEAVIETVTTGWEVIDQLMGGGLPLGKLGIIIAPTGIGKTWFLCALGAAALKAGKNVLHYSLELDEKYVARRYDCILSGIPMDDLTYSVPEIKNKLKKFNGGSLHIKEFPPGTLSLHSLEANIDKHILTGNKPDIVILDYAELLKIDYNKDMRDDKVLGELYKDMRGMAGSRNFAFWSADQTNRSGNDKDVVGGESISNSFAKLFAVDFWMSISRRSKDKVNNTARGNVGKNRMGPDGMVFPIHFNPGQGIIQIFDERSDKGQATKKDMVSDAIYEQQQLSSIYNSLNKQRTEPNDLF